MGRSVLTINGDAKTKKGRSFGYLTGIQYLAPHKLSGYNTCKFATKFCSDPCLNTAGRGAMNSVQKARVNKTLRFFKDTANYINDIDWSIKALIRKCDREKMRPVVRLDGTSDIRWDKIASNLFDNECQFYDYTKNPVKMQDFLDGNLPANYHITFSWSGNNLKNCLRFLRQGGNVAIPMDPIPKTYKGFPVIIGDESDLRFIDRKGCWVALTPKGKAKNDTSGFVVRNADG